MKMCLPIQVAGVALLLAGSLAQAQAPTQAAVARSQGQDLYLPIYSHIWHGEINKTGQPAKTLMSVSVSVRNTDPMHAIRVTTAQYFDTDGKRLREYVPTPRTIGPLGTLELFVPRSDDAGGSGANFLISWRSDKAASPPVVEALHADLSVGRSVAFTSSARAMPQD